MIGDMLSRIFFVKDGFDEKNQPNINNERHLPKSIDRLSII
jgi:hypothetical protein